MYYPSAIYVQMLSPYENDDNNKKNASSLKIMLPPREGRESSAEKYVGDGLLVLLANQGLGK